MWQRSRLSASFSPDELGLLNMPLALLQGTLQLTEMKRHHFFLPESLMSTSDLLYVLQHNLEHGNVCKWGRWEASTVAVSSRTR